MKNADKAYKTKKNYKKYLFSELLMEKAVALVYTQRIRPRLAILYWRVRIMCVLIVAKYRSCLVMPSLSLVFLVVYTNGDKNMTFKGH